MMTLLERPLPILIVGGVIVGLLLVALLQTRKRGFLWGILIVTLMTLAGWLFERAIITPREQVETTLHEIAAALEQNEVEQVLRHISPQARRLQQQVRAGMALAEIRDVKIKSNLEIQVDLSRTPPQAVAEFNVVIVSALRRGHLAPRPYPGFFRVILRQETPEDSEDGETVWRVTEYEDFDPITHRDRSSLLDLPEVN